MSIFKSKLWWSNEKLRNGDIEEGTQNSNCLKVDKFKLHSDSDCIIVGEGSCLKIHKPSLDKDSSHTLLEIELNYIILQVDTGKFISGSEDRQILILHPQSYIIYKLNSIDGHTDAGEQNSLVAIIKHSFKRKAHSATCGPFGKITTRDLICVQSLDGSLSFFDQDAFLFLCIFNDIIIPGPLCYIPNSDSFVIFKSTWLLEIYSYQQLREFSELSLHQNKKSVPQWIYNVGEEISGLQVIQTSNNFSSVIALGERHFCCFQDNGLMKFVIKFDYMPMCFYAYLVGWYYEPTARLLVAVASDDAKLYIYEETTLLWSCDLLNTVISLTRCFLKSLPGGLVTLSHNGIVNVLYMGTEPDLNANSSPMLNEAIDPEQIQNEIELVEETLKKVLTNIDDQDNPYSNIDHIIQIKADVGKPAQNLFQEFTQHANEALHLLMSPVVVILTCKDPKQIQNIQVTYSCTPPFACSESTVTLHNINGTEIIEVQVFLTSEADVSDTKVKILFTITDISGKIIVLTRNVLLPLSLYCSPTEVVSDNHYKLHVQSNHQCLDLMEVFIDFTKEEFSKHGNSGKIVTLGYRTTNKTVTLKTTGQQYSVEGNDFTEISSILDHLLFKLSEHYIRMDVKDFRVSIRFEEEITKQIIYKFLKSIDTHAKERMRLLKVEEDLNVLQRQFILIQKKLLIQYGSLPPGDCNPLEFLMKDTHKRIINSVQDIIHCREIVRRSSSTLVTIGRLIIIMIKQNMTNTLKIKLLEEMLCLDSLYDHYQEWEEAVTQALNYFIKNVFKKSEKDKEKLSTFTEQGILTPVNLKRFLKQMRITIETMFSEVIIDDVSTNDQTGNEAVKRIEEFVEVF